MRCPPGGKNPFLIDGETVVTKQKSSSPDAASNTLLGEESNK